MYEFEKQTLDFVLYAARAVKEYACIHWVMLAMIWAVLAILGNIFLEDDSVYP